MLKWHFLKGCKGPRFLEGWKYGGYPDGLKGEENSIGAQLTALADVYDALVSDRVYKSAYPMDKAYEMIKNGECGVFSEKLMACFEFARPDMEQLVSQTKAEEAAEKMQWFFLTKGGRMHII